MIHILKEMMARPLVGTVSGINLSWPPGSGSLPVNFYFTTGGDVTHYEHVINGTSYGINAGGPGTYTKTVNMNVPGSFTFTARAYYNGTLMASQTFSGNLTPY